MDLPKPGYAEASAVFSTQMAISMLQTMVQYRFYDPALAKTHIAEAIDVGTTVLNEEYHHHLPEIAKVFVQAIEAAQAWASDNPPPAPQ